MSLLCPDHTDEAVAIGELQFVIAGVVYNSVFDIRLLLDDF